MVRVFTVIKYQSASPTVCGWSFAYGGDGSIPLLRRFDQLVFSAPWGMLAETEAGARMAQGSHPRHRRRRVPDGFLVHAITIGHRYGRGGRTHEVRLAVCAFSDRVDHRVVYLAVGTHGGRRQGSLVGDVIGALDFAGGDARATLFWPDRPCPLPHCRQAARVRLGE